MTAVTDRSSAGWPRTAFVALCVVLGLFSLAAGDRLARAWLFEIQLGPLETLRADGGQYVVNEFLSGDFRPTGEAAVVFGDSANDSMPETDDDRRFITQMLEDELGGNPIDVFGVSFPGNSPAWIASHLRYLLHRFPGLDYAVIPLNLRWVSPGWRSVKGTTARRSSYELYAAGPFRWVLGIELPYISPHNFDPKKQPIETVLGKFDAGDTALSREEFTKRYGGDWENATQQIRWLRIALSYGFQMSDGDPLFAVVERIGEDCAASGLRCLFYLPPFNLDYIERSAMPVAQALRGNIEQVRAFMRSRGLTLLDLSSSLSEEHFHDVVNEHVDQDGRRLISGCIAATLRAWHDAGRTDGPIQTCAGSSETGFVPRPLSALE